MSAVAAHVSGSGDVPAARHSRHAADGQPDGEGPHGVQGSAALDEGRLSGTGPGHLQTAGKVPQGRKRLDRCRPLVLPVRVASSFPCVSALRSSRRSEGLRASLRS